MKKQVYDVFYINGSYIHPTISDMQNKIWYTLCTLLRAYEIDITEREREKI